MDNLDLNMPKMIDEIEIKSEIDDKIENQCRACLSVGRKLLPIGKYLDIYRKLVIDYIYNKKYPDTSAKEKLCWECHSQLRRAYRFQQQVIKASDVIQHGQCYIYGTLSCLTTIIMNDRHLHTIYVNESNIQNKCGTVQSLINAQDDLLNNDFNDIKVNDTLNNDESMDNDVTVNDDDENISVDDKVSENCENKEENEVIVKEDEKIKRKSVSKWAKKRASLNKKPKFKIVLQNDLDAERVFRRVQIDAKKLKECVARDRESDSFKASRYKCESCVAIFKSNRLLTEHNLLHAQDAGPCTCDICQVRMSKRDLEKHMKRHHARYECSFCSLLCREEDIAKHLAERHAKVFQCVKCDLQFGCRQDFSAHFKDWHEKYICDHCGVSFKMRYCIKEHLRKQHSPFECRPCSKRFARYNGLWLHNKLRHAPPLPPAYCVECDKQYRDVYRYRWHLANSTRHKPKKKVKVPCPQCEKVFTKKIYMTNHYEYVHLKRFRYRCEACDKNFIRNADLVKHTRKVHEGVPPPRNKICYVCGKGFHTNRILSHHVRTHTRERPCACAACPARFAQRAALSAHARALHPAHLTHATRVHQESAS